MTGYYQPYWLKPDELEHYGIKGMKWGKKKNPYELVKTDFNDVKVGETIDWIAAKDKYDTLAYGPWIDTNAKKINITRVRQTLKSTSSKTVKSLSSQIVSLGRKVISSILNKFKKPQPNKKLKGAKNYGRLQRKT